MELSYDEKMAMLILIKVVEQSEVYNNHNEAQIMGFEEEAA